MHFNVFLCLNLIFSIANVTSEIKLINVLFRHGDRAPGNFIKSCPNDPHANSTFFPIGVGGLTNEGKLRVYKLGKLLRSFYDEFLGKIYLSNRVEAVSSESARAQMSLQIVLAALYPPTPIQRWDDNMNWQPVLMSYKSKNEDTFFVPQLCEIYQKEYKRVYNTNEFQQQIQYLKPSLRKLAERIGRNASISLLDMNHLYHTLDAKRALNLSIPEWANDVYPNGALRDGTLLQYSLYGYNDNLKRLSGGVILHKILNNMKNVQNESPESAYKIHVYSGHELNIVMLLQALGLYDNHIPQYSSSIIIELHEINDQYYVKILYFHGIPAKVDIKKIPGCYELCPFNDFLNLLDHVIPTVEELQCSRIKRSIK